LASLVGTIPGAWAAPDVQVAQAPAARPAIDPAAMAALERMGEHLAKLQSFEIKSTITFEYILDNDQKILVGGTALHRVRRPDRLRIDLATDVLDRLLQYDGKSLVITARKEGYYGRLDAKPTIRETLIWAAQSFGIEMPLADLFDWGTPD